MQDIGIESIKVLYRDIEVSPIHRDDVLRYEDLVNGCFQCERDRILYDKEMKSSQKAEVIIHELLHAIDMHMGVITQEVSSEANERIINYFAKGITTVMYDNPDLFSKLQSLINIRPK